VAVGWVENVGVRLHPMCADFGGLVDAADADGRWTLQTSVFPEIRASVAFHRSAGFRTLT
jgi:L-amino acid N-acyltransferase YncA